MKQHGRHSLCWRFADGACFCLSCGWVMPDNFWKEDSIEDDETFVYDEDNDYDFL
jgi:hypothetical protein